MALRFAGKHAAVVGATGVIGSRIAQALAQQGAAVTLLSRSVTAQRARLSAQLDPAGGPHRFLTVDVSDPASIRDVFAGRGADQQQQVVGLVDVLVNCAGISQTTFLKRTPDEELARIVDTNLLATMLVCKHARMQPHGCIINVSSLMATHGGFGATAYAASKAGLIAFTRALCLELAPRSIRVNALLPGWVDSDMWQRLKPELQQAFLKDTPLGRVADPAEVADAAVFLASNQFANNCILNLDGGLGAA
ncbi:3-ketoacyl-(acyl-carrier) reductase [Cordyceps militaris]|uniref:3-ketoacyl-(Acyl-carrier) reductase n=1 Tax=Cordyceps militaris TaxID=73501 RepID=A0A2H4STB9_CORMI|nr:3-ketoacyl-(acyl-carrier) reductase [Cordyceps militaris]